MNNKGFTVIVLAAWIIVGTFFFKVVVPKMNTRDCPAESLSGIIFTTPPPTPTPTPTPNFEFSIPGVGLSKDNASK